MRPCGRLGEVGGGWGGWWRWVHVLAAVCIATTSTSCTTSPNLHAPPARYEPAHHLGQPFHDVQPFGMLEASKTFPDARLREIYYCDSYFTILGLIESGRTDLVKSMLDNFAHLIVTVGHIPNGNRTYYLSRSQPPFFAAMVGLYARATDTAQALQYL